MKFALDLIAKVLLSVFVVALFLLGFILLILAIALAFIAMLLRLPSDLINILASLFLAGGTSIMTFLKDHAKKV